MEKKTDNDLIRIFMKGDQVLVEYKPQMTQNEMNILIGAFQEMVKYATAKPEIRKGKLWTN